MDTITIEEWRLMYRSIEKQLGERWNWSLNPAFTGPVLYTDDGGWSHFAGFEPDHQGIENAKFLVAMHNKVLPTIILEPNDKSLVCCLKTIKLMEMFLATTTGEWYPTIEVLKPNENRDFWCAVCVIRTKTDDSDFKIGTIHTAPNNCFQALYFCLLHNGFSNLIERLTIEI
jgi:hypothetical protein